MTQPYAAGERVRVRLAFPPGHVRTPWYVRGRTGTVERLCGTFENPERLAYGRRGDPQRLYRVRFEVAALWEEPRDADATVDVELYEHWLEPAENTR